LDSFSFDELYALSKLSSSRLPIPLKIIATKEKSTTMEIFTPLSFWMQLASFFFTMSGIHGDLMVIRLSLLVLAYLMLFMNSVLGSPLWPDARASGGIFVDSLVWSVIGLYIHGSSLICLILDERPVSLADDEAAL
jgi:hypothetical protein